MTPPDHLEQLPRSSAEHPSDCPAYLALVTGAPVIPVTMLGTRPPGGGSNALPERGDGIDIVFGRPWRTTQQAWPRTREHVAATSVLLRGHMLSELDSALSQTRRSKPWPLPAGQSEDDPDTGLVEHPQRTVDTHE